jgi:hypothetical protein
VGGGHISDVLKENGYTVHSTDLINRGYEGTVIEDFLKTTHMNAMDIITNPPYKLRGNSSNMLLIFLSRE